ncbi:MAG: lamin tail domain-containing protein, partial [Verrucomicrobiota bacterium]
GNRLVNRGPGKFFRNMRDEGDPEFRQLLADTIHKHYFNNGVFTEDRNIARLQRRIDEIKLAFIAESARWNYRTLASWQTFQDDLINNHFPDLTDDMIRAFKNEGWYPDITAPLFLQRDGQIEPGFSLQMKAGTIFKPQPGDLLYTLDGSDPRLPGGAVATGALTYERNGPGVPLEDSVTVKARTHTPDGEWSALTEAAFHVGRHPVPGDLVISEIHYRPALPSEEEIAEGFDSRSSFEFLELYNRSEDTISLTNVIFNEGLGFDFAEGNRSHLNPGELAVIVADQSAFGQRYDTDVVPDGQFQSGRLNNGGEALRLSLRTGEILQEIRYDNNDPWPESPDGTGKSLTLKDPTTVPVTEDPAQWQASVRDGGTPGTLEDDTPDPGGDDQADLDGDGLPTFAEAALGTSDTDPTSGVDRLTVDRDLNGGLIITLQKAPEAPESQFELEISDDLRTWAPHGFTLEATDGNPTTLIWTREEAEAKRRFIRLVIKNF